MSSAAAAVNSLNASSKIHASKSNPNLINNETMLPGGLAANISTNPSISINTCTNNASATTNNTNNNPSNNNNLLPSTNQFSIHNSSTSVLDTTSTSTNNTTTNPTNLSNYSNILTNSTAGSLVGNANSVVSNAVTSGINSSSAKKPPVVATLPSTTSCYSSNDERQIGFYQEAKSSKTKTKTLL